MTDVLEIVEHDELLDLTQTEDAVVVKYWATWCGPCARFANHFEQVAERLSLDAVFVAVDVDKSDWATELYGVRGIPAVHLFRGDERVELSARTAPLLLREVKSHLA